MKSRLPVRNRLTCLTRRKACFTGLVTATRWEGQSFPVVRGSDGLWNCAGTGVTLGSYARHRGEPHTAGDLTAGNSCVAGGPGSMWRTVSFLAAQASLTSCSEARMSTIRDVMMVRNTGCRNSRRIPRPINRSFSIEPPHMDPAILAGTGSGQYCGWPQISSLPRPRIKSPIPV
jgi:hypothetical protein